MPCGVIPGSAYSAAAGLAHPSQADVSAVSGKELGSRCVGGLEKSEVAAEVDPAV